MRETLPTISDIVRDMTDEELSDELTHLMEMWVSPEYPLIVEDPIIAGNIDLITTEMRKREG